MYTAEDIKNLIVPVPRQVTALKDQPLVLTKNSTFRLIAPGAQSGPAKTAEETMRAFLSEKCGEACFTPDGLPVTLELGSAPAGVKNEKEAYRIRVGVNGITITGFGETGLFYGVISLRQMCRWNSGKAELPAVDVLDWPDNPIRAYFEECRYGSNVMEKQDWFDMVDDLAEKKLNNLSINLYNCWIVQYDGRVAECLYIPLKKYPQLKTPAVVKYWSPTEGKWYDYETLPPIFRDDFFGEIVAYCRDRGIEVIPAVNGLGHNTLFPRMLPEVAPRNEDGTTNPTGFCTNSDATYELLFSVYDQIIDEHLIPNGMHSFSLHLDEVRDEYGVDPDDPYTLKSPWCKCPKCRDKDHRDLFIEHVVKLLRYLKEKGMTSVIVCCDMLAGTGSKMGYFLDKFLARINEEGLQDILLLDWWDYVPFAEHKAYEVKPDEVGQRCILAPWNGYYIWSALTNPVANVKVISDLHHESKCSEGEMMYAMWDKSYDRVHDCYADYCWNYDGVISTKAAAERYIERHFPTLRDKVRRGFRLMDWIVEHRMPYHDPEHPTQGVLSASGVLLNLDYYTYTYFDQNEPFPTHFPGQPLRKLVLPRRLDYERQLYIDSSLAKEALAIFEEAARTPGCDQAMARRFAYECENYQVLAEDWLAFLEIYDLTQGGDQKKIAPIARERQKARLALMERCERTKEKFVQRGATMRNQSIFMQTFADIAHYVETTDEPKLDLMDITAITSPELRSIR